MKQRLVSLSCFLFSFTAFSQDIDLKKLEAIYKNRHEIEIFDEASILKKLKVTGPLMGSLDHTRSQNLCRALRDLMQVTDEQCDQLVWFIEHIKTQALPFQKNQQSFYINASKVHLPFSIQIYRNGKIYVLSKDSDPNAAKGGYKEFSRSLDYDSLQTFAHLETALKNDHIFSRSLFELAVLKDLTSTDATMSVHNADVIRSSDVYKLTFEAEIYEGDLTDLRYLELEQKLEIAHQIVQSLQKIHERGYIHRDIKLGNIFYKRKADQSYTIAIADFGLSDSLKMKGFGKHLQGTRGFMPPEFCEEHIKRNRAFKKLRDGVHGDVFSLGVMLYRFFVNQDEESKLKSSIREFNLVALPKGDTPTTPSMETLEDALSHYAEEHSKDFPNPPHFYSVRERVTFFLHALVLKMMHPNPKERIALPEAKDVLIDLQKMLKEQI